MNFTLRFIRLNIQSFKVEVHLFSQLFVTSQTRNCDLDDFSITNDQLHFRNMVLFVQMLNQTFFIITYLISEFLIVPFGIHHWRLVWLMLYEWLMQFSTHFKIEPLKNIAKMSFSVKWCIQKIQHEIIRDKISHLTLMLQTVLRACQGKR